MRGCSALLSMAEVYDCAEPRGGDAARSCPGDSGRFRGLPVSDVKIVLLPGGSARTKARGRFQGTRSCLAPESKTTAKSFRYTALP